MLWFCTIPRISRPSRSDPVMIRFWLPQNIIVSLSITSSSMHSGWTFRVGMIFPKVAFSSFTTIGW